jgi:hypothetical protein
MLLLLTLFLTGCTGADPTPVCDGEASTLAEFDFLERGMSFEVIVDCVGLPDEDIGGGGGSYVFTYNLNDGSKLIMGFLEMDSLYSVYLLPTTGHGEFIIEPIGDTLDLIP